MKSASDTMTKAADAAKKAIAEAEATSRKRVHRFGGRRQDRLHARSPTAPRRREPRTARSTPAAAGQVRHRPGRQGEGELAEVLEKAVKQFDPSDPTSPMAKHSAELTTRQRELTELIGKNHDDVLKKVDDLTVALKLQEARTAVTKSAHQGRHLRESGQRRAGRDRGRPR